MANLRLLLREATVRYRPRSVEVNRICSRCLRQHVVLSKSTLLSTNSNRTRLRHGAFLPSGMKFVLTVQEGVFQIDKKTYCGQNSDKDSEELQMLKQKCVKEKSKFNSQTEKFMSDIAQAQFLGNSSESTSSNNIDEDFAVEKDNAESRNEPETVMKVEILKSLNNDKNSDSDSQTKGNLNDMDVTGVGLANNMVLSQDSDLDSDGLITGVKSDFESSSSDEDGSDLVSDESSDEEAKLDSSLDESGACSDLDKMKKEGLTSEEMIKLIEQFGDNEDFSHNELDNDSDIELTNENISNYNDSLQNDDAVFSTPSRHFDESGVISLVNHDTDKCKSSSKDWSVEEIEDFVNITTEEVDETQWQPPVSLQRGVEGVFDIQELVELLRVENIQDLVTIRIPPEKNFGDYMVIGTAKSFRHLSAVSENVNWIYKQRKLETERFLKQEGKKEKSGWIAVDLGNIILHLFLPDQRELYDLETLWTVGSKYDSQSLEEEDPYALSIEDHPWLKELEEIKSGGVNK